MNDIKVWLYVLAFIVGAMILMFLGCKVGFYFGSKPFSISTTALLITIGASSFIIGVFIGLIKLA